MTEMLESSAARKFPLAVITLIFAASCMGTGRWHETDSFVEGLKCGMTIEEIREHAKLFVGTEIYSPGPSNYPDFVVKKDATKINLWLKNGGLDIVEITWISGPAQMATETPKKLCERI